MEKERKNTRRNRGITLIALVITVIILLILAGISIAELTGTGIFAKAKEAKQKYKEAEELENQMLADYESQLNSLGKSTVGSGDGTGGEGESGDNGDGEQNDEPTPSGPTAPAQSMEDAKKEDMFQKTVNSTVKDEYDNQVVIPAGFKVTDDASNVTEGIVIIDQQGNEFVWIPVGTIYDSSKVSHTIALNRYQFDSSGSYSEYTSSVYIEEDSTDIEHLKNYGNIIAKNINAFKNSATTNHGYYIGRYEARKNGEFVTENGNHEVYNYIKQDKAANLSRNMYTSDSFESDLMNSYAWDTAILFEQTFDDRKNKTKKYFEYTAKSSNFCYTGTKNRKDRF